MRDRSPQDPRLQDPQKKLRKLQRLIAHPATSAEERAAARLAVARLEAASVAQDPQVVRSTQPTGSTQQGAPPAVELGDPPEIANEWNPGPWIDEKSLDNAWDRP